MLKKMMLLAMAVAALAIPASASAASGEYLDNGAPFEGEIHETLSGWLAFDTGIGGMKCDAHPTISFTSNEATISDLGITTVTCEGFGALAGCQLANDGLHAPAKATPTSGDIDIKGIQLTNTYAECSLAGSLITFPNATATPNNPSAISTLTISGTGTVDPLGLSATATGVLTAENPGTIGLAP